MIKLIVSLVILSLIDTTLGQFDPHFIGNRQGIVHLFEWKWLDIAQECEDFLGPKGYGGVQISPPNENAILANRPWYERYQPMSYRLQTRSGTEEEFKSMIDRCRDAGVRIFADIVVNHMAAPGSSSPIEGTDGSEADPLARDFPSVPYDRSHFHQSCSIQNYSNATEVRDCELVSLPDLDQSNSFVREQIVNFMNTLIDYGIAGFRMDACKHMSPADLRVIYGSIKPLSSENGFIPGTRPFFYQEVIDMGNESVRRQEYTSLGTVTEFTYSIQIGMVFRKIDRDLSALQQWGPSSGFLPSRYSFVFVDNHDNQRGHGSGGNTILTYKEQNLYTKAVVFMLSHPHGGNHPRVMSSFSFNDPSQGPPQDSDGGIISRGVDENNQCTKGWVCEHRWSPIANMIKFRAVTDGTVVKSFTNIAQNQISFCRGNKGFVAINNSDKPMNATVNACLPDGQYCDVISGDNVNGLCTGKMVKITNGKARIELSNDSDGILAIHIGTKATVCKCEQLLELDDSLMPLDLNNESEDSLKNEEDSIESPESFESAEGSESTEDESPESMESPESPESAESSEATEN